MKRNELLGLVGHVTWDALQGGTVVPPQDHGIEQFSAGLLPPTVEILIVGLPTGLNYGGRVRLQHLARRLMLACNSSTP
jgi:hypothetical protein